MTGKAIESVKDKLDGIVVDAVMAIAEKSGSRIIADEDNVIIKKQKGATMDDAELIRGIVIDKTRVDEGMPKSVKSAKVALVASPLEIKKTQVKAKIRITSSEQMEAFDQQEKETLQETCRQHRQSRCKRPPLPERYCRPGPVLPCKGRHPRSRRRTRERHEERGQGTRGNRCEQGGRRHSSGPRQCRSRGRVGRDRYHQDFRLQEPEDHHHPPPGKHRLPPRGTRACGKRRDPCR